MPLYDLYTWRVINNNCCIQVFLTVKIVPYGFHIIMSIKLTEYISISLMSVEFSWKNILNSLTAIVRRDKSCDVCNGFIRSRIYTTTHCRYVQMWNQGQGRLKGIRGLRARFFSGPPIQIQNLFIIQNNIQRLCNQKYWNFCFLSNLITIIYLF